MIEIYGVTRAERSDAAESMFGGILLVTAIYVLFNLAMLYVLPIADLAASKLPAPVADARLFRAACDAMAAPYRDRGIDVVAAVESRGFMLAGPIAVALNAANKRQEAVDNLIEIVRRDRKWNDDGARKQLVQFLEAWGPTDEATVDGRKRLSSILFS